MSERAQFSALPGRPAKTGAATTGANDRAVQGTARAWQCLCNGTCDAAGAAQCLYARTLEMLSESCGPDAIVAGTVGALARVVAGQRTARGHALCQDYARAIRAGEGDAALDACRALIELAGAEQRRSWDDLPGHI